MSFSDNLASARKRAHLSQRQLSDRSGISQQAISKLESGINSPSEFTMRHLANALGVSVSFLIDEEGKTPTVDDDGLRSEIIARVQVLSDPALERLSDFLDGLQAGQAIASPAQADPDPD